MMTLTPETLDALYPHSAALPPPRGIATHVSDGALRQYRFGLFDQPQGGQRIKAVFLSAGQDLVPAWREVKRSETLEALAALLPVEEASR